MIQPRILKYLIFVFLLIGINILYGQQPNHISLNNSTKLPSNEIYSMIQDDNGYVWIGCDAGLFKYDGFDYQAFSNPNQNGKAISFLQKDAKNRIWCKNFFGQIYLIENDKMKIVVQQPTSYPSEPIFTIDSDAKLWYCTSKTLIQCDDNGVTLKEIPLKKLSLSEKIIGISGLNESINLFDENLNASSINSKDFTITNFNLPIEKENAYNILFTSVNNKSQLILVDPLKDSVFYIFETSFNEKNLTENKLVFSKQKGERIFSLTNDGKNLMINTSNGSKKIENGKISEIFYPTQKISSSFQSDEKQFWFSSLENGIYVLPNTDIKWINASNSVLKDNHINTIYPIHDRKALIGTYQGDIYEFNSKVDHIKEVYSSNTEKFINVKCIKSHRNYHFISRGRLTIIDTLSKSIYYPKYSNIRDFAFKDDTCFMVFPNFILKINISDLINNNEAASIKISDQGGKAIAIDSTANTLYLSLSDGTYKLEKGNWSELKLADQNIYSSKLLFKSNTLWIATISQGVLGFSENKFVHKINTDNYLKENEINTFSFSNQDLWIATNNYLHRLNIIDNSCDILSSNDGISPMDINQISFIQDTVYLATTKGIIKFPESISQNVGFNPEIFITGISMNNEKLNWSNAITLPYANRNLKIFLSSVSMRSNGKYTYHYKLEGIDEHFSTIPALAKTIQFSKIPPGKYTLIIKAVNEDGVESDSIFLPITVSSIYWQKWWFYLILSIVFAGMVLFIFGLRIRYIRKKSDAKNALIQSQLTALKAQMNPHFMFNTLNSLQDLILKQDFKSTNYFLSKYATLIRMILHNSEKQFIAISEEIKMLDIYLQLEKLRFGDDFSFNIEIDSDSNLEKEIPSMMVQPFVENAIKHGLLHKKGDKNLSVSFSFDDEFANCTIIDNGIGRDKSSEINKRQQSGHQSFSTDANLKRAALLSESHNNDFRIEIEDLFNNDMPTGTRVSLKIPFR